MDSASGEILEKEQEMVFLQGGRDELAQADKSRKALRYGAHNVDFDVNGLAYVAHLYVRTPPKCMAGMRADAYITC